MASVYLVARTTIDPVVMDKTVGFEADPHEGNADTLAEFAGRNCYQSFHRPNPKTAANKDYLANILRQSHESVLEHSSATFYVEGCSRSLLAELSRHRHLSFSVVSQRYVDATDLGTVDPPAIHRLPREFKDRAFDSLDKAMDVAINAYLELVKELTDAGLPRKKAREAARAVLPQATDSPMVVTGNLRAWRDVIRKRFHVAADAEIQQFAADVLAHLRSIAPNSFQDIPEVPYE